MHVLMLVDMEGISQIRDYRELWAAFPDYWTEGRQRATDDAVAAARGLLEGGAAQVTVCEMHGPVPGPVVDAGQLPDGARWVSEAEVRELLRSGGAYDAVFMAGWHARCGTANSFVSHTEGINLRIAIDRKPVTECHLNAWRAGVPTLGITGDAALRHQLDGVMEGVPFLPVKRATSRATAQPLYTGDQSRVAIQAFASWCAANTRERKAAELPERFTVQVSMRPDLADMIDGHYGLRRTSPAVLATSATDWWDEVEPAIQAAVAASFKPWEKASRGLDLSSLESLERQDELRLDQFRAFLHSWVHADEAEWLV